MKIDSKNKTETRRCDNCHRITRVLEENIEEVSKNIKCCYCEHCGEEFLLE